MERRERWGLFIKSLNDEINDIIFLFVILKLCNEFSFYIWSFLCICSPYSFFLLKIKIKKQHKVFMLYPQANINVFREQLMILGTQMSTVRASERFSCTGI